MTSKKKSATKKRLQDEFGSYDNSFIPNHEINAVEKPAQKRRRKAATTMDEQNIGPRIRHNNYEEDNDEVMTPTIAPTISSLSQESIAVLPKEQEKKKKVKAVRKIIEKWVPTPLEQPPTWDAEKRGEFIACDFPVACIDWPSSISITTIPIDVSCNFLIDQEGLERLKKKTLLTSQKQKALQTKESSRSVEVGENQIPLLPETVVVLEQQKDEEDTKTIQDGISSKRNLVSTSLLKKAIHPCADVNESLVILVQSAPSDLREHLSTSKRINTVNNSNANNNQMYELYMRTKKPITVFEITLEPSSTNPTVCCVPGDCEPLFARIQCQATTELATLISTQVSTVKEMNHVRRDSIWVIRPEPFLKLIANGLDRRTVSIFAHGQSIQVNPAISIYGFLVITPCGQKWLILKPLVQIKSIIEGKKRKSHIHKSVGFSTKKKVVLNSNPSLETTSSDPTKEQKMTKVLKSLKSFQLFTIQGLHSVKTM